MQSCHLLLGYSVSFTTLHQSVQLPRNLKYNIVAQASIWDRGTQLIILQDSWLMWQAGTFGMMQLVLPEGQKRKVEAEIRVLSRWLLLESSTELRPHLGRREERERKLLSRGKWRWKRSSKTHCSEGESKGLMVFVQGEGS